LLAALNITKMHRDMKDMVLATTPDELASATQSVNQAEQQVYTHLDTIRANILGEKGLALEKQTRELFEKWRPIREDVFQLLQTGNKQGAISITTSEGADHVALLEEKMLELSTYARHKADGFIAQAENAQAEFEKITLMLTLLGIFLSIFISIYAIRSVRRAETSLLDRNNKLQTALDEIEILQGILPICSFCKKVRNDDGYYEQIDAYFRKHANVGFSHTVCPSCMQENYPEQYQKILARNSTKIT